MIAKRNEIQRKASERTHPAKADGSGRFNSVVPAGNHRSKFIAARDSRNRRIPGLYLRNGRYYAQLWVDVGEGKKAARRFPLRDEEDKPVRTLVAAREALDIKRHDRRENRLPTIGHKPLFRRYCATYFEK